MSRREPVRKTRRQHDLGDFDADGVNSAWVFGLFWLILSIGTFFVAAPWAGFHGVLFGCVGMLVLLRPSVVSLPRHWWWLAGFFLVAGLAVFLPVAWFGMPDWRRNLESLGLDTGAMVVIQARQAAEMWVFFAIMLITGMWLAGHRASASQLRTWSLAFAAGVALYAVVARLTQNSQPMGSAIADGVFGFFPNRNHSATYLAMGAVCGLGCVLQAIRDKRFVILSIALAATGICLWAVAAWSVSRAGVVLVAVACLLWLPMLGRRYLGRNGVWAVALIALAAGGLFLIADSSVKQRLTDTVEKAGTVIASEEESGPEGRTAAMDGGVDLDFRIPTALDTFDLIRDFKWTGIGAGQYYFVFPQYRKLTAVANHADSYHPESDWLWMASETGVVATFALLVLVILAARKSRLAILRGKDRALRSACLVAALLVPIHGIFDVPGHRITLAWSAAFLFALSLQAAVPGAGVSRPRALPFRFVALTLLLAAVFLTRAQWFNGPESAVTAATNALAEAKRLYAEDQGLQKAAAAEGRPYQPDPGEDLLEQALGLLAQASPVAPLDRGLKRYDAFLALQFDDKYDRVDRDFAIDLALDPTWVNGPLRQAEAWLLLDSSRVVALWNEALLRADDLDRMQSESHSARERALQTMHRMAKGRPELEEWISSLK